MKLKFLKPDFSAKDFFKLYTAISFKNNYITIDQDLFKQIYEAKKNNEKLNFLFEDIGSKSYIDYGYVELEDAYLDAYNGYLLNIQQPKENVRAYIAYTEEEVELILEKYDEKYILGMQEIFETISNIRSSNKENKIKNLNK